MARTIGRALARNDAATVRTLFVRYPRRVKLENDHLHIAVLNCDGRVHRRIAVPQRMAVSLGPQTSTI